MHWYTKYRGVDDDLPIIIVPENVFEHAKKRVSEEKRYERKQRLQKKLDQIIILKKSDRQNKRRTIPIRQDYLKPVRPRIPKTRLERKLVIESDELKFLIGENAQLKMKSFRTREKSFQEEIKNLSDQIKKLNVHARRTVKSDINPYCILFLSSTPECQINREV